MYLSFVIFLILNVSLFERNVKAAGERKQIICIFLLRSEYETKYYYNNRFNCLLLIPFLRHTILSCIILLIKLYFSKFLKFTAP